jgi:glutamate carboxypeptidase
VFNLNEYCKNLEQLVNIDSGSDNPRGVNLIADFFEKAFDDLGWSVERHHIGDPAGDFLKLSNRPSDHYDLMMIGHMDTVFPAGTAIKRPFRIDGNLAYGPGVSDMKSGILAMYYLVRELQRDVLDNLSICIVMNPDEEIGSIYSRPLVESIARQSDYAFVLEGTALEGIYTIARKGSARYEVSFSGIAEHAGYILERKSASAVREMAHWILELSALTDPLSKTSVNVGVASGGIAANSVPDFARILVDCRYRNESELQRIEKTMECLRAAPFVQGTTAECKRISCTPPMVPTEETRLYMERVRRIFKKIGMPFDLIDLRGGGSDGNFISSVGTICLDSLGPRGGGGHSDKEYLMLDKVGDCLTRMKALIEEIAFQKTI